MKKQSAIIFGCNGYLGRNMVAYLQQMGWQISGADIQIEGFQSDFSYSSIDVTSEEVMSKIDLQPFQLIFFFSGLTGTWKGFEIPDEYLHVNELGLINLLRQMQQQNATGRIVFPSTRLVYKGVQNYPLRESETLLPLTPYAVNKLACEQYLYAYKNAFNIGYTVFRLCIPYGNLTEETDSYGTIGFFEKMGSNGQPISVFGDGSLKRTFTHMKDIVRNMLNVSQMQQSNGEVYNMGGETFSLLDVATMVAKKYKVPVTHTNWPENAAKIESGDTIFNCEKIEAVGAKTTISLLQFY